MPKIQLKHQGQTLTLAFQPNQTTKQNIQKLIQTNWGLRFEDVQMTYCDSDGDQITVDIQEDFQVAKQTMTDGDNDTLVFIVKINTGVAPKINVNQDKIEQIVEHEPSKIISVQSQIVHQENVEIILAQAQPCLEDKQNLEQNQKQIKIEQEQINIPKPEEQVIITKEQTQVKAEPTQEQKLKKMEKQAKKKAEVQAKALAKQIAKEEAQRKKQQKEEAKKQAQRKKQQKEEAKKQDQRKKQQKEAAKKQAQRLKQQKSEEKKKKIEKKQKLIQKQEQKSDQGEIKVKLVEQSGLTEKRIKQLIRNQVLSMLPELRQKILEKEQKIIKLQQKSHELRQKIEKEQKESCSECHGPLNIPFYYNSQSRQYLCGLCEATFPAEINLLKIRNPKHFSQTLILYGGEVKKPNIDLTDVENYEKYIEQSRLATMTKIKQEFKRKLQENRKIVTQIKQKQQKNKIKKEEEL